MTNRVMTVTDIRVAETDLPVAVMAWRCLPESLTKVNPTKVFSRDPRWKSRTSGDTTEGVKNMNMREQKISI